MHFSASLHSGALQAIQGHKMAILLFFSFFKGIPFPQSGGRFNPNTGLNGRMKKEDGRKRRKASAQGLIIKRLLLWEYKHTPTCTPARMHMYTHTDLSPYDSFALLHKMSNTPPFTVAQPFKMQQSQGRAIHETIRRVQRCAHTPTGT